MCEIFYEAKPGGLMEENDLFLEKGVFKTSTLSRVFPWVLCGAAAATVKFFSP